MNIKTKLFFTLVICFALTANAQKPFKEIGKDNEVNVVTLRNGRYVEYFTYDTLRQIGSAMFNTKRHKVEYFITQDDTVRQHIIARAKEASRFMSVDPLASKYPTLSPYTFVANNPIIFIDPDGREVKFAKNVSEDFKKIFAIAVQHLNRNNAGRMLAKLQASDVIYYVAEKEGVSSFDPNSKTIYWDPSLGLRTNSKKNLSPTTILNHEIDHATEYDKNKEQYKEDTDPKTGYDDKYGNKEEKRVIEGSEKETATKLGEIDKGETTRTNHKGQLYETDSPTSNDPKVTFPEVIITPVKKNIHK